MNKKKKKLHYLKLEWECRRQNFFSEVLFLYCLYLCYLTARVIAKVATMSKVNLIELLLILYKHETAN